MGVKSRTKKASRAPTASGLATASDASGRSDKAAIDGHGVSSSTRDVDQLDAQDWPLRPIAPNVPDRSARFQVIFKESVIADIRDHGLQTPDVEVCGVLVGNVYRDRAAPYCYVEANIRGTRAAGRNAQVTFTSETWTQIHEAMDAHYAGQRIVGWYHTHPGFGIFLSEMDLFIQQNFFAEPWQVAFVDDPKGGEHGVFIWRKGQAVREPFLLEPSDASAGPQVAPAPAPAESSQRTPGPELDISARLRALQRDVDRQRVWIRWLVIGAIFWPILLLTILFWRGVLPIDGLGKLAPRRGMAGPHATSPPAKDQR